MIQYLRNTLIDKNRWNDCINRSINRRVYAYSWYLDLVCPGWDALVEGDYTAVFPLTHYRKWSVNYLAQPYFTQQLGVFSDSELSESHIFDFIRKIPAKFKLIEIHLNSMNKCPAGLGETKLRMNHELNLSSSYEELAQKYGQNARRNIRKANESGLSLTHAIQPENLVGLFRDNFGKKEGKLNHDHYAVIQRLILHCIDKEMGHILGVYSKDGELSAAAFFLFDQSRIYFLFAASAPSARENGAMFFLIDRFIASHAGTTLTLDFEGGNDPNLGRFYKSFGALEIPYPTLQINRLSKVAERGLYFMRKLRE